jgi:hypothetical protein
LSGKQIALDSMKNNSDREVVIFTEAVKLPSHERPSFLQRRCAGDEPLRRKIAALLKALSAWVTSWKNLQPVDEKQKFGSEWQTRVEVFL